MKKDTNSGHPCIKQMNKCNEHRRSLDSCMESCSPTSIRTTQPLSTYMSLLLLSNLSSSLSRSPHVQQPLSKSSNLSSGRRGSLWITWPLFEVASYATSLQVSQSLLMLKTSLQITQPLTRPQKLSLIHTTTIRGCIECNISSSHRSIPGLQYNRVAKCRDLWNEKQEP